MPATQHYKDTHNTDTEITENNIETNQSLPWLLNSNSQTTVVATSCFQKCSFFSLGVMVPCHLNSRQWLHCNHPKLLLSLESHSYCFLDNFAQKTVGMQRHKFYPPSKWIRKGKSRSDKMSCILRVRRQTCGHGCFLTIDVCNYRNTQSHQKTRLSLRTTVLCSSPGHFFRQCPHTLWQLVPKSKEKKYIYIREHHSSLYFALLQHVVPLRPTYQAFWWIQCCELLPKWRRHKLGAGLWWSLFISKHLPFFFTYLVKWAHWTEE